MMRDLGVGMYRERGALRYPILASGMAIVSWFTNTLSSCHNVRRQEIPLSWRAV